MRNSVKDLAQMRFNVYLNQCYKWSKEFDCKKALIRLSKPPLGPAELFRP